MYECTHVRTLQVKLHMYTNACTIHVKLCTTQMYVHIWIFIIEAVTLAIMPMPDNVRSRLLNTHFIQFDICKGSID